MFFKKEKNKGGKGKSKDRKNSSWNKGGNSRQRRKQRHDISEEQKAFITSSILNKRRLFIYVE